MSTKKTSTPSTTSTSNATPAITPAPATPAVINSPPPPLVTGTANASNHGTKVDLQAMYQAVIAGLLAYYQPGDQFLMKAGTFTRDELVDQFQGFVAAAEKTKADNQVWRQDVQSERELQLTVQPLRAGVRGIVQARFGKGGAQLLQFGFPPAKPAVRTAASKLLAAQKAAATREARQSGRALVTHRWARYGDRASGTA